MSGATRLVAGALVRRALRGEAGLTLPHLLVRPPGGSEWAVALPAELTVGRGPEAGLALEDAGASRLHARIRLGEDGVAAVEDLGSKNGLRLNGRPLPAGPAALRAGDELQVGDTVLRYQDPLAGPLAEAEGSGVPACPAGGAAGLPREGPAACRSAEPGRQGGLLAGAAALLAAAALLLALG